jgi:hypothetical protein
MRGGERKRKGKKKMKQGYTLHKQHAHKNAEHTIHIINMVTEIHTHIRTYMVTEIYAHAS